MCQQKFMCRRYQQNTGILKNAEYVISEYCSGLKTKQADQYHWNGQNSSMYQCRPEFLFFVLESPECPSYCRKGPGPLVTVEVN